MRTSKSPIPPIRDKYDWAKVDPYDRYFDFIAPDADRYTVLIQNIEKYKLNSAVIPIEGNRHIFIFPPGHKSLRASGGVFPLSNTTPYLLTAHYDRVTGSPGANDNSIAVFLLLNAAITLTHRKVGKWMIIFTDKEELKPGEGPEEQGSFSLAKKLKLFGLEKSKIFNFDACGTGDTFILSTLTDEILKRSDQAAIQNIRTSVLRLRDRALVTADTLRFEKILLAPTPFSDDVGFLRAGLASQTITILPSAEAEQYEALLRTRPDFADLIISGKVKDPQEYRRLPETWRNLNSALDTPSRLTPDVFKNVINFILQLVMDK